MARVVEYEDDGSGGWQPLPEGGYDFRINGAEEIPRKGNQKSNQLRIDMEVVQSPDGNNIGKKSTLWIPMSVGWRVSQLLEASGIAYEESGTDRYSFDLDELINCYVYADVTVDATYIPQGQTKAKIKNEFTLQPSSLSQVAEPAQEQAQQAPAQAAPAQTRGGPGGGRAPAPQQTPPTAPSNGQPGAVRRRGMPPQAQR